MEIPKQIIKIPVKNSFLQTKMTKIKSLSIPKNLKDFIWIPQRLKKQIILILILKERKINLKAPLL